MRGWSRSSLQPILFSVLTSKALKRKLLASLEMVVPFRVSSLSELKYFFAYISFNLCRTVTVSYSKTPNTIWKKITPMDQISA